MLDSILGGGWFDYLIAPLAVFAIVKVVQSVNQTFHQWQRGRSEDNDDARSIAEFLFGRDANPRTKTPPVEGWTTQVDRQLHALDKGQLHTIHLVEEVLDNQKKNGES